MVAVFRSMERGLTISVSQEKKVSLRFRLWTSRPRAQIIFVSRSRALMSAYVRISKIRTFARQGPRDLETKIISGRGRVVHERNRRFTGSFHFSACRRCRDLVCRTATHGKNFFLKRRKTVWKFQFNTYEALRRAEKSSKSDEKNRLG